MVEIDGLRFDEGVKPIIRDNLFEFYRYMVEEKKKNDKEFWKKLIAVGKFIGAIAAIIGAMAAIYRLYHSGY